MIIFMYCIKCAHLKISGVYQNSTVVALALFGHQIQAEPNRWAAIAKHHAIRIAEVSGVNCTGKATHEGDLDVHDARLACGCHQRSEFGILGRRRWVIAPHHLRNNDYYEDNID